MKYSSSKILSYLGIVVFLLYWVITFTWAMPFTQTKKLVAEKIPRFNGIFGFEWKLFTPPHNCNNRLYFVAREVGRPGKADTIEVLEGLAMQKQEAAPFNQKENLLDKIVNNVTYKLLAAVY